MVANGVLDGRHILIVEDEAMIALDLTRLLEENGATVVGPAGNLSQALGLIAASKVDCAAVDIGLGGERVWPVVEALEQATVPFVFLTAYSEKELPLRYRSRPIFQKPMSSGMLIDAIAALVAR